DELSVIWREQVFDNKELPEMIRRYIARNYPEFLSNEDEEIWHQFKGDLLERGMDQARTFLTFFQILQELKTQFPTEDEILEELFEYGQGLLNDL
ncbi:MAG: hypothetical protein LUC43_05800, partial [Burkholderiales bacterium]|nr:hypothetical protein [Burkholderiales bacterium]